MLTVFFGESHQGSPNSSPGTPRQNRSLQYDGTWTLAASAQLPSGLPGTLSRGDSKIQSELAGIQNRLKKIAQLRDNPPSSPRNAEHISPWLSLSSTQGVSTSGDLARMRTLGRLSPTRLSPLKASSPQLSHLDTQTSLQPRSSDVHSPVLADAASITPSAGLQLDQ